MLLTGIVEEFPYNVSPSFSEEYCLTIGGVFLGFSQCDGEAEMRRKVGKSVGQQDSH